MTKGIIVSLVALIVSSASGSGASELDGAWAGGFGFRSGDGLHSLKIGVQTRIDWAVFPYQDDDNKAAFGNQPDGTEFRMARLCLSGAVYGNVGFKAQYELATGDPTMESVYLELRGLPGIGNLRVGHTKEPLHMETITGTAAQALMERSAASALAPSGNSGIMVRGTANGKRIGWQAGLFRETDASGKDVGDDHYAGTGRVYGHIGGLKGFMAHVGVAYSYRNVPTVNYEQRAGSHLGSKTVRTGPYAVNNVQLIGTELLLRTGSLWIQTEAIASRLAISGAADPMMLGWYAAAGYVLTGERRGYKASSGTTSGVSPARSFDGKGGIGAIELIGRISELDLNDGTVSGGRMRTATFGVNWFLNPVTLVTLNAGLSGTEDDGRIAVAQMRVQLAL